MLNFIKNTLKRVNDYILLIGLFLGITLFYSSASADYAPKITNINDGYLINLSNDSFIDLEPIQGSDNNKSYYRIGQPIVVNGSGPGVTVTGWVNCTGNTWGNEVTKISEDNAFHRLWITAPLEGTKIEGLIGYRINSNVAMTVERNMYYWTNIPAPTCAMATPGYQQPVYYFTAQFPFTVRFYIHDIIIDSQVLIPPLVLGGYVRAFTTDGKAPNIGSWPLDSVSVPLRLAAAQLAVKSSCKTKTSTGQASTVNLRHGQLNTLNYDSLVREEIIYSCNILSPSASVRLRLEYTTDGDEKKRLPMVNILNKDSKIYSELKLTDQLTGQTGKELKLNIKDLSTIEISSHIQGSNAMAGDYQGSAWLIATFD